MELKSLSGEKSDKFTWLQSSALRVKHFNSRQTKFLSRKLREVKARSSNKVFRNDRDIVTSFSHSLLHI